MNKKLYKLMDWAKIEEIIYSECDNPGTLLGPHKSGNNTLIQAYFPGATDVKVRWTAQEGSKDKKITQMEIADDDGYFAVLIPEKGVTDYKYLVKYDSNESFEKGDPYRHSRILKDADIKKFREGKLLNAGDIFGSHIMEHEGETGASFIVWAPGAMRVSVVGEFNEWDGRINQMTRVNSDYFEIFIPGDLAGMKYQYEIKLKGDKVFKKNDPYSNILKDGISVVCAADDFKWSDKTFFNKKRNIKDMIIYELSDGYFSCDPKKLKKEIAALVNNIKDNGYTYVMLNPSDKADPYGGGCGYFYIAGQATGSSTALKQLVDSLHEAGIRVIFDWMPAGFSLEESGLKFFDGTSLYGHLDPKQGLSADGKRGLFQYGRGEVKSFLLSSGLRLIKEFHADGISIAGVAQMLYLDYGKRYGEWVPNMYGNNENLEAIDFIKEFIVQAKKINSNALIMAEDSSTHKNITAGGDEGIGFDIKWNEGFLSEYFDYISHDPIERGEQLSELTDELVYSFAEKFVIPLSDGLLLNNRGVLDLFPGNEAQRLSTLRLSLAYAYMHPGYKLISQEFDDSCKSLLAELNELYLNEPALCDRNDDQESFEWLSNMNREQSCISFIRKTDDPEEMLIAAVNFSGIEQSFTTGVPYEGKYKELINTDDASYGGTGIVNAQVKRAIDKQSDGRAQSITVKLAPLSVSIMKFVPYTETELAKVIEERIRRNTPIKKSGKKPASK
ncbi:MAG: alpha amylase C-terminal domain-containing protein [Lachnospiraceae bacterium]|nr:alpha amylase C-terminal domain-containing protein [Lachnospiraceae bacterium]